MGHSRQLAVLVCVVALSMCSCSGSTGSLQGAAQADEQLRRVALFKNGLGFFILQVEVPEGTDSFYVVPEVAASHGTYWVSPPEGVTLKGFVAREIETQEQVEATTLAELLEANAGREVRLYFGDRELEGRIKYVVEKPESEIPSPYAPGRVISVQRPYYGQGASLMVVETQAGQVAVNPATVTKVDFIDAEALKTIGRKKKVVQLDFELDGRAGGKKLLLSYLAKGVTWAPSYMVDISDAEQAVIAAKAVVMNEVCNWDGVSVELVTGFPSLQFADIISPLAMKEDLAAFLQSLIRGESERRAGIGGVASNVMRQRAEYFMEGDMESAMPSYGSAQSGKTAEDLFLYPIGEVKLGKGEVGYFGLFTESVPYRHVYRWQIPDYVNEEDQYYDGRRSGEPEPEEEVWHCVRLENTMNLPWTTAPAEVIKEDVILGQNTLEYTAPKAKTTLKITRAISVKAEQVEFEIDRKRDAAQIYGRHYDLITVEGKLSVTNFQDKAITLEITKMLSGEMKTAEPEAKIEKMARGLRRMNPAVKLTWEVELAAGEHKEVGYTYDVYVRR